MLELFGSTRQRIYYAAGETALAIEEYKVAGDPNLQHVLNERTLSDIRNAKEHPIDWDINGTANTPLT